VGAPESFKLNVPGEDDAENVIPALEYLKKASLGEDLPKGDNVIVVGGGNVAIDAARTALRKGAGKVTMVMLESAEEQPASPWEIEEAMEEGVVFVHRKGVGPSARRRQGHRPFAEGMHQRVQRRGTFRAGVRRDLLLGGHAG
jgi:NADPH-dependent glutamate synthase beta subunit-like oxidoreductase